MCRPSFILNGGFDMRLLRLLAPARLRVPLAATLLCCAACDPASEEVVDDAVDDAAFDEKADSAKSIATEITVENSNDRAFQSKVDAIDAIPNDGKPHTIDLAYYIYGDDYSASYFTQKLLEKAQRGVKVRLLVDAAQTSPGERAFFRMVIARGGRTSSGDNLQVAFFRPTPSDVVADLRAWGFAKPEDVLGALFSGNVAKLNALIAANPTLTAEKRAALLGSLGVLFGGAGGGASSERLTAVLGQLAGASSVTPDLFVTLAGAQLEQLGLGFHGEAWLRMTKFLHFKLLVVDKQFVQGGGRNIEDPYNWNLDHPLRVDGKGTYVFMDTDFSVRNGTLATAALATFNKFWACRKASACTVGVEVQGETAADDGSLFATMTARAGEFSRQMNYARREQPLHDKSWTAKGVSVRYLDNRMFRASRPASTAFPEEASAYHKEWVRLLDATTSRQTVFFYNAYLFLPPDLQYAVTRAARRGVKVTLTTNSPGSSDLGIISKLARLQYAHLLGLGVRVLEVQTQESLHSKVSVIGDNLIVGSGNADPRSQFLDTNNGVVIGKAAVRDGTKTYPSMAAAYLAWVTDLLDRLKRTQRADAKGTLARDITLAVLGEEAAEAASAPVDPKLAELQKKLNELVTASFELDAQGKPTTAARKAAETVKLALLQL